MASNYLTGYRIPTYSKTEPKSGASANLSQRPGDIIARASSPSSEYGGTPDPTTGTRYGGGSNSSQATSRTVSRSVRSGSAPELPDTPKFVSPKVDKRKIKAGTQKAAAPGIRRLRDTVQQAMGRNYENPNVRRMTLKEALRGYGAGLENIMSGASQQARSEHMAELDLERQEAYANFQAENNKAMAAYNFAWQDYMKGTETVSETTREQSSGLGMDDGESYQYSGQLRYLNYL